MAPVAEPPTTTRPRVELPLGRSVSPSEDARDAGAVLFVPHCRGDEGRLRRGRGRTWQFVGSGLGLARRVSWACTGDRREFRETEVPENTGRSRGKAPTGRAGRQIQGKCCDCRRAAILSVPSSEQGVTGAAVRRSTTLRTRRGDGRRSAGLAGRRDSGHQRATRVAAPRRLACARNRRAGARQPRAPSAQRRPGRCRLGRGALRQHPLPGSEPHPPRRVALGARGSGREQLDRPPDPGAGRHRESPPAPAVNSVRIVIQVSVDVQRLRPLNGSAKMSAWLVADGR